MKGAVLVAIAASIGNFLQGWDNATIAGILTSFDFFIFLILVFVKLKRRKKAFAAFVYQVFHYTELV